MIHDEVPISISGERKKRRLLKEWDKREVPEEKTFTLSLVGVEKHRIRRSCRRKGDFYILKERILPRGGKKSKASSSTKIERGGEKRKFRRFTGKKESSINIKKERRV